MSTYKGDSLEQNTELSQGASYKKICAVLLQRPIFAGELNSGISPRQTEPWCRWAGQFCTVYPCIIKSLNFT